MAEIAALAVFRGVIIFQDGRRRPLLHFVKMVDVVAPAACRDVLADWWR